MSTRFVFTPDRVYTETQIILGLEVLAQWYEGWKTEDLSPDQLLECIREASARPKGEL